MTAGLFDDPRVAELLGPALTGVVASTFRSIEIAEDEIAQAGGSRDDQDDPIWKAFTLLRVTDERMSTEFVYRSHCREILERVRYEEDTRPGTDAEIALGIAAASMEAPMSHAIVGLQARLFKRAFPEQYERLGIDVAQYERLHAEEMDRWERKLREKARQDWRTS